MKMLKKFYLWTTLVALLASACAYLPLSRKVTKWTAESCGRKSLGERFCSGVVTIVATPIEYAAIIIDLPLSILEFWFGWKPFQDPLITAANIDFEEHLFAGIDSQVWKVQRSKENPTHFTLTRMLDGRVLESFIAIPLESGGFEVMNYNATQEFTSLARAKISEFKTTTHL